jgi:hypothetical protein
MARRIERAMALLVVAISASPASGFAVGCASLGTSSPHFTELVGIPPASTGAMRCARRRGCRLAWRNRRPDRSGIEKAGSPRRN